jgi:hypothetical protein
LPARRLFISIVAFKNRDSSILGLSKVKTEIPANCKLEEMTGQHLNCWRAEGVECQNSYQDWISFIKLLFASPRTSSIYHIIRCYLIAIHDQIDIARASALGPAGSTAGGQVY